MSMKYNTVDKPLVCMMTNSTCYKGTRKMTGPSGQNCPVGILWHSTGANNPALKRYVQPSNNDSNYNNLMKLLGKNQYNNDWNHIYYQAGVNAFIGKLEDGTVTTVQVMPWDYRPWGCGNGSKGSCNNGWIQFEICEDNLSSADYFNKVYNEAIELTAYLCKLYNINPNATVMYNGVKVPSILCHNDSYKLGFGTGHADVMHWFPKYGKSMDTVRVDVAKKLAEPDKTSILITPDILNVSPIKEDNKVTLEEFTNLMREYRKTLQDNNASDYSEEARKWAVETGLINGGSGESFNGMWEDFLTREQFVTVLERYNNKIADDISKLKASINALQGTLNIINTKLG